MTFGQRLKESRIQMKMTQKQLADTIGAKHNSVSDWENDKNKPDPDTIELLCGVLGITPNYLLNTSTDEFSLSEKAIIKSYRSLDAHGRELVDFILMKEVERSAAAAIVSSPTVLRAFTYYGKLASAGNGEFIFDELPTNTIELPVTDNNKDADFIVGVIGDSMEPTFYDGDMVYVQKDDVVEIGDIGIFFIGNDCYIKEAGENGLISHNPKYHIIAGSDNVRCIGKVLGKVES